MANVVHLLNYLVSLALRATRINAPRNVILVFGGVLALAMPSGAFGQALEGGGRASALGGAATALTGDAWLGGNVAVGATRIERSIAFFGSESYGLSELRLGQVQYTEPTRVGAISIGLSSFGFEDFGRTRLDLAFARGFSLGSDRTMHFGVGVHYTAVSITSYGSASTIGLSAGGIVSVSDNLSLGFHGTNLNVPTLGDGEELERTLAAGFRYVPEERVTILVDLVKDVRFPMAVRGGIEVQPAPPLFVRAGFATNPTRFSGGVGVVVSVIHVDLAFQRHDVLGWSPAASMSVDW